MLLFFFSSRRRHTRLQGDWSSDVCSSDLAMLAAKKGEQLRDFQQGLLPFVVILVPVIGLIFLEPHLSMAILVAILGGSVLFTAGARIGHFLALGVASTPLLFGAIATAQYRMARVLTFLNPGAAPQEATWQVQQ